MSANQISLFVCIGHLVEGLEFHKFYFDAKGRHDASATSSDNVVRSDISSPKVTLLGDDVALVTYTRLRQSIHGTTSVEACNETRVWQRKRDGRGVNVWKHVHFHRSKAPA
jgi:calcium/calmodulin-dependent protein kinase (CaM kinase) II